MPVPASVLVVGGGLGGLRVVEELRRLGYGGRLTVVGVEDAVPYDRPPLSKSVLFSEEPPALPALRTAQELTALGVERVTGEAVALEGSTVQLADDSTLSADAVVVATGCRPRLLSGLHPGERVHVLRTWDDAVRLRAALTEGSRLLVVGGGPLGTETALAARRRAVEVVLVEALGDPFSGVLGPEAGACFRRLLQERGVRVVSGRRVTEVATDGGVRAVLDDGEVVAADHALVAVGTVADTGWLAGSGALVPDGIVCDEAGRVEGLPGVHAVGDVASWHDPLTGRPVRVEHWSSAGGQATVVARDLLGQEPGAAPLPYVWTDQDDIKVQIAGRPRLADTVTVLQDLGEVKGTVLTHSRAGVLLAVTSFGAPGRFVRLRGLVERGAPLTEARQILAPPVTA